MKQSKLLIDTGLKPISRDNYNPNEGGKTYSFKIVIANHVFYCASKFGDDEQIENDKNEILNNWPAVAEIEVIR